MLCLLPVVNKAQALSCESYEDETTALKFSGMHFFIINIDTN